MLHRICISNRAGPMAGSMFEQRGALNRARPTDGPLPRKRPHRNRAHKNLLPLMGQWAAGAKRTHWVSLHQQHPSQTPKRRTQSQASAIDICVERTESSISLGRASRKLDRQSSCFCNGAGNNFQTGAVSTELSNRTPTGPTRWKATGSTTKRRTCAETIT